ncbi:hypothetical protein T05_15274 [Trichinella murrelli]|uniref:Retropepsins domain-containing protein n=1 Tax=Trichinella murrelli TaxID=144512 RepID=A0A0V0T6V8_9BILA|nr:hypothetical protein T05_15274 [Trichinella murrelli]
MQTGDTPCVNGKLSGTKVSLLLDTGAVVSVIPESLWQVASVGEPLERETVLRMVDECASAEWGCHGRCNWAVGGDVCQ